MSELLRRLDRGYQLIWREGRMEDALSGLPPDFEWITPELPDGEVRHGPEGVIAFFREWLEAFPDLDVDWELLPAGPDRALAVIVMRGSGRESGAPAELRFGQIWTFREGVAVRMVMYSDLEAARRDAGL